MNTYQVCPTCPSLRKQIAEARTFHLAEEAKWNEKHAQQHAVNSRLAGELADAKKGILRDCLRLARPGSKPTARRPHQVSGRMQAPPRQAGRRDR